MDLNYSNFVDWENITLRFVFQKSVRGWGRVTWENTWYVCRTNGYRWLTSFPPESESLPELLWTSGSGWWGARWCRWSQARAAAHARSCQRQWHPLWPASLVARVLHQPRRCHSIRWCALDGGDHYGPGVRPSIMNSGSGAPLMWSSGSEAGGGQRLSCLSVSLGSGLLAYLPSFHTATRMPSSDTAQQKCLSSIRTPPCMPHGLPTRRSARMHPVNSRLLSRHTGRVAGRILFFFFDD